MIGYLTNLNYKVHKSGSSGNCVQIEDILIDIGINTKELKEMVDLSKISSVIITHEHADHINKATLKKVLSKDIYVNSSTYTKFKETLEKGKSVKVYDEDTIVKIGEYIVSFIAVEHDVMNYAIQFISPDCKILYATDLMSTDPLPQDIYYNYIFLEANFDEYKAYRILEGKGNSKSKNRIMRNLRHLSKQESLKYVLNHCDNCEYIKLHKSSDFY